MFVILPFEKDFYQKWNYEVEFVGHPLLDAIGSFSFEKIPERHDKPVIALLPGSRRQEIGQMLPLMLSVVQEFPDHQFIVAGVNSVEENFYHAIIGRRNCRLLFNQTYSLLSHAKAALVTSGTATLETALFGVPEVVCYKGSPVSYWIGRQLVDVKFISLVNLVLDRPLVKELIQGELSPSNIEHELGEILFDEKRRKELLSGYRELKEKLGGRGPLKKPPSRFWRASGNN
jgi:lipid-A-disaccharide synthase